MTSGLKLDRLVVLVRHGARTTLSQAKALSPQMWIMENLTKIPENVDRTKIQVKSLDGTLNNPHSDKEEHYRETVLPGGGILGQLTSKGYDQAYDVGQYLRRTYGEFAVEDYYIRSTNIYRTIETARGVLAGWRDGAELIDPVPIFVEADTSNEFMYPNGELPYVGKGTKWIWEAPGLDDEILKMNKIIIDKLKVDFESDFSGRHPIYLRDDITARWEHGFSIESELFSADDLNEVMPLIQKCSADLLNLIGRDSKENEQKLMPMVSGRLLDFIVNQKSKVSILGAHDTTLGPMLCALRVAPEVNNYWPRFCAHIDFEFLSNDSGEQFVRVLYDETPIKIGGASESLITLEEFLDLTKWVRMSQTAFEAASKMDDSDWKPKYTADEIESYVDGKNTAVSLN